MGYAAISLTLLVFLAGEPPQTVARTPQGPTRSVVAAEVASASLTQASAALDAGEPERVLKLLTGFVRQHPRNVASRLLIARAHLAREEYAAAHDHLRRALDLAPRNIDVLYYLGIVTSELAAQELNRVHQLAPTSARAHLLTAESLVLQQNYAEAIAEYELALQSAPDLLEALIGLGELRREQADCAAAIALYERAQAVRRTYEAAFGQGMCLAVQNEHARAVAQFRSSIELDPSSAAAYFALGSSLLQIRDPAGAVAALQRAISLQPRMRQAYYLLGRTYRMLGKHDLAREALARVDELMRDERARDEKTLGVQPPGTRVIRRPDRP